MRAYYTSKLAQWELGKDYRLDDEQVRHLIKVVRIKPGEDLLLLDGAGTQALSQVQSVGRSEVIIQLKTQQKTKQNFELTLAIGLTKKEAFDEIVRNCVELGITRIIPLQSNYSQHYPLNKERLHRIALNALKQSNNLYLPEILPPQKLTELSFDTYQECFYCSLVSEVVSLEVPQWRSTLLVIGPEGGFADQEDQFLAQVCHPLRFEGPILRAPTAISVAYGYLRGRAQR